MTDPQRMAGTHGLPSGTLPDTGLILRHYDDPDRRALAAAFGQACRARGIVFLVAGDWRLALACGADGLHLPSYLVARRAAWKTARSDWIVTAAVHTMGDAMRAWRSGVDGVLVSPVFPTRSHPGAPALGPLAAARLAAAFPGPVFALGGMDEGRWRRLAPLGFAGWAGIGAWTPASPAGDAE